MKIRYLSDLHLEFFSQYELGLFMKQIEAGNEEVCVLAGDIGNPWQPNYDRFIKFISRNFKKVFVIAGNHEYYNKKKTMEETNTHLRNYFTYFTNVSFLDDSYEYYNGFCFIGTTLWSKITDPQYKINDVIQIPQFDWITYNELNAISVEFLEETLANNENCIVITHHMPSPSLIDPKYKTPITMPYNQWFCCDMEELVKNNKDKIKCWFYGHTHSPSIAKIHDIPFLCNPIGYKGENSKIDLKATWALDE